MGNRVRIGMAEMVAAAPLTLGLESGCWFVVMTSHGGIFVWIFLLELS